VTLLPGRDVGDDDRWVLHFYVKDTGIGLDECNIKSIFNSFQQVDGSPTRKYDGTGLGLAISQRLCEAMGGTMWAESPGLGMGSTFHFSMNFKAMPGRGVNENMHSRDAAPPPPPRGTIENKHSTDVASSSPHPPPPSRLCGHAPRR
jgi:hypothetical protein